MQKEKLSHKTDANDNIRMDACMDRQMDKWTDENYKPLDILRMPGV